MAVVLQFSDVAMERISGLSFTLDAHALNILRMTSREEKAMAIELALGEKTPERGAITLNGGALDAAPPGSVGWVPAHGGLISNLKVWENVTLPLWYHGKRSTVKVDESVRHWLAAVGLASEEWEEFMASPPGRLNTLQRKMAGLLRGLVQVSAVLVLDEALFDGVELGLRNAWVAALEEWTRASEGSVLVISDKETILPWTTLE